MAHAQLFPGMYDKPLAEVRSDLASLTVVISHSGSINKHAQKEVTYGVSSVPMFVPCPNPDCKGGGHKLKQYISQLVSGGAETHETTWSCDGKEGKYQQCLNRIDIRMTATYQS